jgi:hypothetical protein
MTENKIGFGVLGPLLMTVDGAPVPPGTPKQRAVLAVLVMNRNRPVGTDSLGSAMSRVRYLAGGYSSWHRRTTPR